MHKLKKLFCALVAALCAIVSVDEYILIIYGFKDDDRPDEHEECWQ